MPTPIPPRYKTGTFALGCQAWTFNRFTVFEAIEKTALVGGRVIELFPGQRTSDTDPAGFDHHAGDAAVAKVQAKLRQHDILMVNYGVVGLGTDEREARRVFQFAKKMGLPCVTSEPDPQAFDLLERLVKEFDIRLALHDHPRRPNDPGYRYWNPEWVLSMVQHRDRRMGSCADTGHWARSGIAPVKALRTLRGRVMSSHLKDLTRIAPDAHDVPYGTGACDVRGILDELKAQRFDGNISIEYEHRQENNVAEVAQCVGFVRGYGAGSRA